MTFVFATVALLLALVVTAVEPSSSGAVITVDVLLVVVLVLYRLAKVACDDQALTRPG